MKMIIYFTVLLFSLNSFAQEKIFFCEAHCVQVDYENMRVDLLKSFAMNDQSLPTEMYSYMKKNCLSRGANTYLVQNSIDFRSYLRVMRNEQHVSAVNISVRRGFLGIGRKTSVSAVSASSYHYEREQEFEYKVDLATFNNSCVESEYDPDAPLRYLNGENIFG